MMNRKTFLIAMIFTVIFISFEDAATQTIVTGRSIGLAGSGTIGMLGTQVVGWNPANLGLRMNPANSLKFPSFGFSIGNNAYNPQYISDTFVEGDTLSAEDIDNILSKMSTDQLDFYGLLGIPVFGVSVENFAFSFDVYTLAEATLPRDIFELMMTGPVKDKIYNFDAVDEDAMSYWSASFSASKLLTDPLDTDQVSVGATFKYFGGIAYGGLERAEGTLQVTQEAINGEGIFRFHKSFKGDGVGLDLGAAGYLSSIDSYFGLTLGNLIGSITWTDVTVERYVFSRHKGIDQDSLLQSRYYERFFNRSITTYSGDPMKTDLPRYMILSASKPFLNERSALYFSYYQGFNDAIGQSTTPRIALGTEFKVIPLLPVRFGVALGGIEGSLLAGGFGLHLGGYRLDVGASWQRGMLAGAEGFSIAVTNTLVGKGKTPREPVQRKPKTPQARVPTSPENRQALTMDDLGLGEMASGKPLYSAHLDPFIDGSIYYMDLGEGSVWTTKYNLFFKDAAVVFGTVGLARKLTAALTIRNQDVMSIYNLDPDQRPVALEGSPLYDFVTEALSIARQKALILKHQSITLRAAVEDDFTGSSREDGLLVIQEIDRIVDELDSGLEVLPVLIERLGESDE